MRENRHKRRWSGGLCAAMVLPILAGCAGNREKEPIHINIWTYYNGDQLIAFNELVEEFNATVGAEKGIFVTNSSVGDINELTANVQDSVASKVGSEELPNVFSSYADTAYQMMQKGVVANLAPYVTEEEYAAYVDSYIQEGDLTGDGSLYIFPVAKSTEVFLLNKTDWQVFAQETGATYDDFSTIEGLTATAQRYYEWTDSLTAEPNDGKAFFGRDAMANYFHVGFMQLGQELFTRDETGMSLQFDKGIARKLWDNYYVPFVKGYFSASGRFRSDDIKTGNILAYVGSSSSAKFFPQEILHDDMSSHPIEMEALPAPCFEQGQPYAIQQGAGMVVTSKAEEEVAASVEFLKWFTQEAQNIHFSVESGYLPVTEAANDLETIYTYETDVSDPVKKILDASISTVNKSEMYTSIPFERGERAREVLEYSMSDLATADRAVVLEHLQRGMTLDEATEEFTSDAYFERWYQSMVQELSVWVE